MLYSCLKNINFNGTLEIIDYKNKSHIFGNHGPLVKINNPDGPTREEYGVWQPMQIIRGLPPQPFRTVYANFALTSSATFEGTCS